MGLADGACSACPTAAALAIGRTFDRQKSSRVASFRLCDERLRHTPNDDKMAGIKRKSAVPTTSDSKSKSKKVKVDKPASKSGSKHEVKPVKKSKPAKEESSDDFEESDTSEPENGFYGFSAAQDEDVEMSDADSSEDTEDVPQQNGKSQKNGSEYKQKLKSDASGSKLAGLNGRHLPNFRHEVALTEAQLQTREKRTQSRKPSARRGKPRSRMPTSSNVRRSFGRSCG